jgi:DNA mismatch repair protein MutH
MELEKATSKLDLLVGKDLRKLADKHGVTVFKANGKLNKGWAGQTLEKCLGLKINNIQGPDGGRWELKLIPLKKKGANFVPKETMAITMINSEHVLTHSFKESHLLSKLRKLILCTRIFESKNEERSVLYDFKVVDLNTEELYNQVKDDYEFVRKTINEKGFNHLSGSMGKFVQPRTKGSGHGSTSRAFYARKQFISVLLDI